MEWSFVSNGEDVSPLADQTVNADSDARPQSPGRASGRTSDVTIQRMDHVGVVVDDLEAAISFFVELGMELEGGDTRRGRLAGRRRRTR